MARANWPIGEIIGNKEENWEVLEVIGDIANPKEGDCLILYSDDIYEYMVIPFSGKRWVIVYEDYSFNSTMIHQYDNLGNALISLMRKSLFVSPQFYIEDSIVDKIIESDSPEDLVKKYVLRKRIKRDQW